MQSNFFFAHFDIFPFLLFPDVMMRAYEIMKAPVPAELLGKWETIHYTHMINGENVTDIDILNGDEWNKQFYHTLAFSENHKINKWDRFGSQLYDQCFMLKGDNITIAGNLTDLLFPQYNFSVPLQIKTYFSGVKGLAAHIGVQAGILLSAKDKMTIHSIRTMNLGNDVSSMYLWESYKEKKSENVSSKFRNVVIVIPLGVSYEWRHITLDASYCFELRQAINLETDNPGGWDFNNSRTARNHAIYITAGYKFTL